MIKSKLLLNEERFRIIEVSGENPIAGKHLVVVDIQPEYIGGFKHFLYKFINFLNTNYEHLGSLTFLYNGKNTLDMIDEVEYKMWWEENGLSIEVIDGANFYDKGYAFFRYCIDSGIDDQSISELVKYMIEKDVNDSRELDNEFWNGFVERYGTHNVRELMEFSDDCIYIPDLMEYLTDFRGILLEFCFYL